MVKKTVSLVLAAVAQAVLVACAGPASVDPAAPAQPSPPPSPASAQPVTKVPEIPKTLAECRAVARAAPRPPAAPAALPALPAAPASPAAPLFAAPAPPAAAPVPASGASAPPLQCTPPPAAAPVPASHVIETQRQLDDRMDALHETFRCCYDVLEAPSAPKRDAHIALLVKIDHAGKLTSAEIVSADTDVPSPEVHACILETARQIDYPKPVADMDVGYQRVFEFKARR